MCLKSDTLPTDSDQSRIQLSMKLTGWSGSFQGFMIWTKTGRCVWRILLQTWSCFPPPEFMLVSIPRFEFCHGSVCLFIIIISFHSCPFYLLLCLCHSLSIWNVLNLRFNIFVLSCSPSLCVSNRFLALCLQYGDSAFSLCLYSCLFLYLSLCIFLRLSLSCGQ